VAYFFVPPCSVHTGTVKAIKYYRGRENVTCPSGTYCWSAAACDDALIYFTAVFYCCRKSLCFFVINSTAAVNRTDRLLLACIVVRLLFNFPTYSNHVDSVCVRAYARARACVWPSLMQNATLQCSSHLFLHSFFPDRITATASCLDSLLTSSNVSNLFRTLRLG